MAKKERTAFQREKDLVTTANFYLQGLTQAQIGIKLKLSRQQIGYDIKDIIQEWRKEYIEDINDKITVELNKINLVESECWLAWEKSKKVKKQLTEYRNKQKVLTSTITNKYDNLPNDRYMDKIKWCIETRLKLLGLLPVKAREVNIDDNSEDQEDTQESILILPDNGRTSENAD